MSEVRGAIWWNELMTRDLDRALHYYESVLGWQFEMTAFGGGLGYYYLAFSDGRPVAGCVDTSNESMFDGLGDIWLAFMNVDDCDEAVKKLRDEGGETLRPPMDLPNIGRVAIARDCVGALHGLIAPFQKN